MMAALTTAPTLLSALDLIIAEVSVKHKKS